MATAFPTATTGARTTPTATERTTAPPAQPPSPLAVSNSGNDDSQPKKDAPASCMHKRGEQGLRTAQVFRAVRKAASPQRNTRRTGGESFQRRTKNRVAAWHGAAAALLRSAIYFIACSACLACAAPLKRLKNTPRMRSAARAGLPGTFHRHSTPGAGMTAVPQGTAPRRRRAPACSGPGVAGLSRARCRQATSGTHSPSWTRASKQSTSACLMIERYKM